MAREILLASIKSTLWERGWIIFRTTDLSGNRINIRTMKCRHGDGSGDKSKHLLMFLLGKVGSVRPLGQNHLTKQRIQNWPLILSQLIKSLGMSGRVEYSGWIYNRFILTRGNSLTLRNLVFAALAASLKSPSVSIQFSLSAVTHSAMTSAISLFDTRRCSSRERP